MGKTKQEIQNELKAPGLGGDFSRSTDPNDPRRARAAQAASVTSQRYDPEQFEVNSKGLMSLKVTRRKTHTVLLDFVGRYNSSAPLAPFAQNASDEGGLPTYAAVVEAFAVNDLLFTQFALPPDFDRHHPVTLELNYIDRDAATGTPGVSWDVYFWSWERGQVLSRAEDRLFQIVDVDLAALDTDQASTIMIPQGLITAASTELKFRIQRVANTAAALTDPDDVGIHSICLTYGIRWSHSHGS